MAHVATTPVDSTLIPTSAATSSTAVTATWMDVAATAASLSSSCVRPEQSLMIPTRSVDEPFSSIVGFGRLYKYNA